VQRAARLARLGRARRLHRLVERLVDERVEARVARLDAAQRLLHHLDRRDLALANLPRELRRRRPHTPSLAEWR
jgi:hypothetical protein